MSFDFLNLNREFILRKLEEIAKGIQVNGRRINNIRNADDTVLLATSEAGFKVLNAVQSSMKTLVLT